MLPIDRIAADQPYYSGKEKYHGMNVQVLAESAGRLIWVSDALPGATHDLTTARAHDIPASLAAEDIKCWADKAYQRAGPAVRFPFRGNACEAGADVTTGTTRSPAASANKPWRSSSPGGPCGSSAASPPASQPSSEPSSPSNATPDQEMTSDSTLCLRPAADLTPSSQPCSWAVGEAGREARAAAEP
ncbi:hypothetical protein GCM10022384_59640 [Streptomyces marokkonensis]|uniref:DDE Tnp4 domain-containing protein n=1 Tax=Streptomyces marokkonensis TaxID=324855 RepID=A0ABP7S1D6_9ACTN